MKTKDMIPTLPKYLIDQLNVIAKNEQLIDYTVEVDNGSNNGDGFMAIMTAITLKGSRCLKGHTTEYELPLICKLMPDSATRRESFSSVVMFEREVYFYKTVLPIFLDFLKEKEIIIEEEFSMYPKCFIGLSDSVQDQYVIVMENLKTKGYELRDRSTPMDFDTVGFVLSELGKFHAISFAMRDQKMDIFDKHFRLREIFFDMLKGNGVVENMISGAMKKVIGMLDDKREIDVMENFLVTYENWIKENLKDNAAGRFGVLNHGDLWNNNIMFSMEPKRKLCLVDFQLLRLASPATDISYYLYTSANPEILQRSSELLHIYYDSLSAFLLKLGSDPQKCFTFNDLEDQLRQFGKYGLIIAPILNQVMVSESDDIIDMDSIKIDSACDGLANFNEKTNLLYKSRMSSVIQLAIRNGWI